MQEYRDGSFGPIEPAGDLLRRLANDGPPPDLRAVHIGTQRELEKLRARGTADTGKKLRREKQIARLERRLASLEARLGETPSGIKVVGAEALKGLKRGR